MSYLFAATATVIALFTPAHAGATIADREFQNVPGTTLQGQPISISNTGHLLLKSSESQSLTVAIKRYGPPKRKKPKSGDQSKKGKKTGSISAPTLTLAQSKPDCGSGVANPYGPRTPGC